MDKVDKWIMHHELELVDLFWMTIKFRALNWKPFEPLRKLFDWEASQFIWDDIGLVPVELSWSSVQQFST